MNMLITSTQHSALSTQLSALGLLFALCSLPLSFAGEILNIQVLWNVEDEPLNIGDTIHFKVTTDGPGSVIVDISTVHQTIQLYDDGTNGDAIAGDRVYELDYRIFEGDTVEEGPILAHFVDEKGLEVSTRPGDEITPRITVDGTRPVVTNDGVAPDPFNPYEQVAYIRYILTERSSVTINIYGPQNQLVRHLGTPSGKPGENHTAWNGADDQGNIMPDGRYTYEINARDAAGNNAIFTRGSCILSTVYLEIDNSLIAPNPFSPDGDDVEDVAWITFDMRLIATEEQLRVLGFGDENLVTATTEDDNIISPFALVGLSVFNSAGEAGTYFSHDLTSESDTDFAPNGWPNRKMPSDIPPGSGNFLGLPDGFPDYADEIRENDWDTLVPLNGPFGSGKEQYYITSFAVGWEAEDTPDGTYLIKLECELVGRTFSFVGYLKGEGGMILGEKWHATPVRHHGITAFARRKSVIIDRKDIIPVDDDPPIVTATNPSAGSIIDPTREHVLEIVVNLDDGADGSGVDPVQSSVTLLDPLKNKLGGQVVPYGINTVKLVLDSELYVSGQYTIEIIPVDKRGNKASEPSIHEFVVEDKSAPTVVPNTVQPRPTDFDEEGNPVNPLTQPVMEVSAILTDGLTGSGVDLERSAIYVRGSADEIIEGEMRIDAENKKLIYNLKEALKVSDTYTIVVIATDRASAKGIYTYQFVLDMAENIFVRCEGKTYLVIYASTNAVDVEAGLLDEITVQKTDDFPPVVSEIDSIDDSAIQFMLGSDPGSPTSIQLTQDAELTLYYEGDQLPKGIKETELSIYAFKAQARDWVQLPGAVLAEEKITASISVIDQYYIIAYTRPVAPSLIETVSLNPPNYFNPDTEMLMITFARNMADSQVEIYNVAGDRITILKEKKTGGSLAWDGRNQDGEIVRNGVFICRISYKIEGHSESLNRLIAVVR